MTKKKITEAKDIHVSGDFIAGDQYNYYYTGDFASLEEYYISPESVFQRVRTDDFIGRDWLNTKVDAFLNDPNRKSGAFLLIGDAGVGKTAFMAHLVKERRYLHLFAEQAPGQAMLQRAMQSLGSQLVTRYQIDPYKDRDTLNALSVFPDFLERILRLAASTLTEGEKIVIVCDALDEAGTFPDHFVFGLPKELPDGVYFILSQRPVNVKLPNFEPVIEKLEAQGEGNLQDIESYLSAVAKRPEVAGQIRSKEYSEEFFIQTLKEKSQGVWMYLHYIIKEIENGARAPLDLANLPTGLVGYYAEYWNTWRTGERGDGKKEWFDLYAPLLATLAASQEAITAEQLTQWAGVATNPELIEFELLKDKWRSFLVEDKSKNDSTYTVYHLSFRDFISGKVDLDKLDPNYEPLISFLTKATVKAHTRIVSAFEKECNGEWEKLVEQDYPRLYLTTHLNSAGEYEKLRILLTEGDEKIKWAEAKEQKEETYSGYLNDLTYVWDYAEREQNYALAIRCMLIENSIHSLAANIPPQLLAELAKNEIWSYARCLSTIRENPNANSQAQSLKLIIPDIPPLLVRELFQIACGIRNESARADALEGIIVHLTDELKILALSFAYEIRDESNRASVLISAAQHLNADLGIQAIKDASFAISQIESEHYRASMLEDLVSQLNDELKIRFLSTIHQFENESWRNSVLKALLPYLNDELKAQALPNILLIKDGVERAHILIDLIHHLDDKHREQALRDALFSLQEVNDSFEYASELSILIPYMDGNLKEQSLQDTIRATRSIKEEFKRTDILLSLVKYYNDEIKTQLLQEILSTMHKVKEGFNRINILALDDFTRDLNDELKPQVFLFACEIKDEENRANALGIIAPYLTDDLKAKALFVISEIKDEYVRGNALENLSPYLTDGLKTQAFLVASEIKDEYARGNAIVNLAPYLTDDLKMQAFLVASEIKDEYARGSALGNLAPHLSDKLKPQALQDAFLAICKVDEEWRVNAFKFLVPKLSDELKEKVLLAARDFKNNYHHASLLVNIVQHLNSDLKTRALQEALTAAWQIDNDRSRIEILNNLAPHLNYEFKRQALQAILSVEYRIEDDNHRSQTLRALLPYLNDNSKEKMLLDAYRIENESECSEALRVLLPYLNEEFKTQTISIIDSFKDEYIRAWALYELALEVTGELKEQVSQDAFLAASQIQDVSSRADILYHTAFLLNDESKYKALKNALSDARQIQEISSRVRTMGLIAYFISDELKSQTLQEILTIMHGIDQDSDLATLLTGFARHINDDLKYQVLSLAQQINDKKMYVKTITKLASYMDDKFKSDVIQDALTVTSQLLIEDYERVNILGDLAPHLNNQELIERAFSIACQMESEQSRAKAIEKLAPYLYDKTKELALSYLYEIKDEQIRAHALRTFLSYINGEKKSHVLQDALLVTRKIMDNHDRARVLETFLPHLDQELSGQVLQEALSAAHKVKEDHWRASALGALTPYLDNGTKVTILQEIIYLRHDDQLDFPLPKVMNTWKEIGYQSLNQHIVPLAKHKSRMIRNEGFEMVELFTPALVHFRGPEITDELYRTITDVTRWWP